MGTQTPIGVWVERHLLQLTIICLLQSEAWNRETVASERGKTFQFVSMSYLVERQFKNSLYRNQRRSWKTFCRNCQYLSVPPSSLLVRLEFACSGGVLRRIADGCRLRNLISWLLEHPLPELLSYEDCRDILLSRINTNLRAK
jgi:RNase P subunit RPR2